MCCVCQIYLNPGPNYDVLANQYVSGFNGLAPPPDPIYASSGYILVTFTSDASGGGPGFKAVFSQGNLFLIMLSFQKR